MKRWAILLATRGTWLSLPISHHPKSQTGCCSWQNTNHATVYVNNDDYDNKFVCDPIEVIHYLNCNNCIYEIDYKFR